MAIEFKLESDVGETRVAPKRVGVVEDNTSTIAKQVVFKTDSYESMDHLYTNVVNVSRDYYKAFKEGYGQFLIQHSNAIKEAENLAPRDKEYRLLKLKSSMINEITRLTGDPHFRVYIEACQKFYNDKTRLITSINPIKEALEELKLGFLKEIKGNLPKEFQKVEIYERNINGIPTGNKISLSAIFTNEQKFLQYINDSQVKNFFIHLSENVVDPKLNEIITAKEKAVSEEVKGLAIPIYKAMAGVVVPASLVGLWFSANDYFGENKSILKSAITDAGKLLKGGTRSVVKETVEELILEANKTFSKGAASRLANRAVAHAVLQQTTSQGLKGGLMVGWARFGIASRAIGFMGGPIGLAASLILPFAIDLIIAEAKDAFTTAQGKEPKNQGWLQGSLPIGEWFGACFQDIGRSFS